MNDEKFCSVSEHKIFYTREGSGETILLIHGITTYSFIWRKIVSFLSPHFDVIAIDLLGCGRSDKPLDFDYSIKSQAELVSGFIEKLQLKNVHLAAHDIGGGVAQILSTSHPNFFSGCTLINSVAYDFWPVQPIIAMKTPIIRQIAMATLDFGAFRLLVKRGLYNKNVLTEELMSLFWFPMKSKLGRKAFLHLAESLNNKHLLEIKDLLHKSDIPFLIIRGEEDVYLSSDICETLNANIPKSTLVKVPKTGHYMMEEEPRFISETIIEFVKGNLHEQSA